MKLLLVEDDTHLQSSIAALLSPVVEVDVVGRISEIQEIETRLKDYELLILDEILPDGSALNWYNGRLKQHGSTPPTIFLSGISQTEFIEACYSCKLVVDYVVKPFHEGELIAKVKRALNLIDSLADSGIPKDLDLQERQRALKLHEKVVYLTPTELAFWKLLMDTYPAPITREHIIHELWSNINIRDKTFDVHLSNLRKKLLMIGVYIHFDPDDRSYVLDFKDAN